MTRIFKSLLSHNYSGYLFNPFNPFNPGSNQWIIRVFIFLIQ